MKAPKILPWLARKASVSDVRAEALWAEALRHATMKTGWVGTSEYWRAAIDRLIVLLNREAAKQGELHITPAVRAQARLFMVPVMAWQEAMVTASIVWSRLARQQWSIRR